MASSNKHWPSMFRANPACGFEQYQPQSDLMNNDNPHSHGSSPSSLLSGSKPSLLSSGMDQEGRSTETKARWSPRPEQIRILEAIFNAGVVNPPRDEIRRIRARLQEFGPVADANVFYWFQNRKSRTKHKLRQAAASAARASSSSSSPAPAPPVTPPPPRKHLVLGSNNSSSSSSSDRSSGSSSGGGKAASVVKPPSAAMAADLFAPLSGCSQLYYNRHPMLTAAPEPQPAPLTLQWPPPSQSQQQYSYYLPATELGGVVLGSGSGHAHAHAQAPSMASPGAAALLDGALGLTQDSIDGMSSYAAVKGPCDTNGQFSINAAAASVGVSDAMMSAAVFTEEEDKASWLGGGRLLHYASAAATSDVVSTAAPLSVNAAPSSALTDQLVLQELLDAGMIGGGGVPMATVVVMAAAGPDAGAAVQCYSVPAMARLDVARLFGEAALLLRHTGEPVPVDAARGVTLDHGALYYVLV
ncbi:hypothetical protein BRADI_2g16444v3 [Brachypodium distachyon]|uniref:Homeobox domain-containing protein n=1 Tax=Brachypodium distachyon TaxID=15368 RepID=A0A0Q3MKL3_BRADI|nr:hypothetical protein BRADI_2g16444v3 [Brachypodium distachyon]